MDAQHSHVLSLLLIAVLVSVGCNRQSEQAQDPTAATVPAAQGDNQGWLLHGNDHGEKRFSSLSLINRSNAHALGLAWETSLDSHRGIEATPIVVGDKMYVTSTWSRVMALDAVNGEELWRYDPQVPRSWAQKLCCDIVNRGVAVWQHLVVFGTLDGRLIALDRESGQPVWEVDTLIDRTRWYSITGAPRIVNGKVIIGNGGAEYGVRGYVSAFSVADGELLWRFFTVPGDPSHPVEHVELAHAASTWKGVEDWSGLGGTAWDSIAFDPKLNLLFVGTGNGAPWSRDKRSAGGGDNLYLASILALNPETGDLVWHYQTTPGDNWDFTATQQMILADLKIEGQLRQVLMQAPKNGFFYVLDRRTGELISAEPFVYTNWASHIDMATGKPVETGAGTYNSSKDAYVFPSPAGGHNWHPMSFSESSGLVYIPSRDIGWVFTPEDDKWFTLGVKNLDELIGKSTPPDTQGHLKAWDPVRQKVVWQRDSELIWNGGVLSTAGGLVIHGTGEGELLVLDDTTGEVLKSIQTGTGIIAPPITYAVNGEQFVAVAAGWGGPAFNTMQGTEAAMTYVNDGRLLVYRLNGRPTPLPDRRQPHAPFYAPDLEAATAEVLEQGRGLYGLNCGACHGFYGSTPLLPDLRRLSKEKHRIFSDIVLNGLLEPNGMPNFSEALSQEDVTAIQLYIGTLATRALAEEQIDGESSE